MHPQLLLYPGIVLLRFGSPAGVTLDEGEVEPFPRGGQESLTPLEKRVIHQQAKQELLFKEVSWHRNSYIAGFHTN